MYRDQTRFLSLALAAALAACSGNGSGSGGDAGVSPTDGGVPPSDGGPSDAGTELEPVAKSEKANLRFKRNLRIRNDFAQAMGLDLKDVCKEFGLYECASSVHQIPLGGAEPYVQGLYKPNPFTTLTTPIAVERMALFDCTQRYEVDAQDPANAVVFQGLPISDDGRLSDPEAPEVEALIERLYQRALLRAPTPQELGHHRALYRSIESDGQANAARDWAILSCFSVLTSMESLFY